MKYTQRITELIDEEEQIDVEEASQTQESDKHSELTGVFGSFINNTEGPAKIEPRGFNSFANRETEKIE